MSSEEGKFKPVKFGRYILTEKIGQGGMAEVFRATYSSIDGFEKTVVIKKILPSLTSNQRFVKMFTDEARITVALEHPNIVQVFDLGEIDGVYYMAMEYVHGKDLYSLIRTCLKSNTQIPLLHALYVMMEVCKGLDYAHRAHGRDGAPLGIIHRDISHSNILISYEGSVKVADFGIAKARIQQTKEKVGTLKGKTGYLAPEFILGEAVDHRADLFSMGVVFFEMITMSRLFQGKSDNESLDMILNLPTDKILAGHQTIPDDIQDVLRRSLAKDKELRYQTAKEFYDDLSDYCFNNHCKFSQLEFSRFIKELSGVLARPSERVEELEEKTTDLKGKRGLTPRTPVKKREIEINLDVMEEGLGSPLRGTPRPGTPSRHETPSPQQQPGSGPPRSEEASRSREIGLSGKVPPFTHLKLIHRLSAAKKTGELRLDAGEKKKSVFLEGGYLRSVVSNVPGEDLAAFLSEASSVSPTDLKRISSEAETEDGLVTALVKAGKLTRAQMNSFLRLAYRDRIAELFKWPEGTFLFTEGASSPEPCIQGEVLPHPILCAAARKMLNIDQLQQLLARFSALRPSLRSDRPIKAESLMLYPQELEMARLITPGGKKLGEILEGFEDDIRKSVLLRVAYLLNQFDMLKFS